LGDPKISIFSHKLPPGAVFRYIYEKRFKFFIIINFEKREFWGGETLSQTQNFFPQQKNPKTFFIKVQKVGKKKKKRKLKFH